MRPHAFLLRASFLALLPALLTGCSLESTAPAVAPEVQSGVAFRGITHGGQQPIVGAHVYLFAAGTGGYGGSGIAASTANASTSLLNGTSVAASNGAQDVGWGTDGTNYYVITDGDRCERQAVDCELQRYGDQCV